MADNVLELTFSVRSFNKSDTDTKKDVEKKKREKENILATINQNVCALLNSNGGKLILKATDGDPNSPGVNLEADKIVRPTEQYFQNIIATSNVNKKLRISNQSPNEITLTIKGHASVCTLSYNTYLPTDTQVLLVSPVEVETLREILDVNRIVDVTEIEKNVPSQFILGCSIGIKESKTAQFKNLKAKKEGNYNLASRLINNKLTHYVSAFANHCGGRIYCGVRDDGTVEGETVTDKDKADITKEVSKHINKMKWPEYCGQPQRSTQWDVSFEQVTDSEGNPIESKFVIIIFVAACQGGVFCAEPESYHIIDGKAMKMTFDEWKWKLLHPDRKHAMRTRTISRCDWSSPTLRLTCDSLDGKLLRLINNGKWNEFKEAVKKEQGLPGEMKDIEVSLVLLSKWFVFYYRKSEYENAENCLEKFRDGLQGAKDYLIFDVRGCLILSAMERTRGNHQKSYEIAKECLFKVEQISPSILTAEFYVHFATMLTIIEGKKELRDLLKKDLNTASFREEAIVFYNKALQHLRQTDYVPRSKADMEQKTHINLAILNLGCSLSGDVVDHLVTKEAIDAASSNLECVSDSINKARNPLSGFRKCHQSFAQSSLFYRSSQFEPTPERRIQLLESALQYAEEVKSLADMYEFHELSGYAKKHASVYEKELEQQIQFQP